MQHDIRVQEVSFIRNGVDDKVSDSAGTICEGIVISLDEHQILGSVSGTYHSYYAIDITPLYLQRSLQYSLHSIYDESFISGWKI